MVSRLMDYISKLSRVEARALNVDVQGLRGRGVGERRSEDSSEVRDIE